MAKPIFDCMKILVTGATGMVGGEVIREAIKEQSIESVTALTRKPVDFQYPKLKNVIHSNFLDYSGISELLSQTDVIIWCLGVPQARVTKEQYRVITVDYTMAAAQAALAANPGITFIFVSGAGADSNEKSRITFARFKGEAENKLMKLNFKKLFIARPAGIQPVRKNPNAPLSYKLFYLLYPLFQLLSPGYVIKSSELAMALLNIAKHGADTTILNNRNLQNLAKVI